MPIVIQTFLFDFLAGGPNGAPGGGYGAPVGGYGCPPPGGG